MRFFRLRSESEIQAAIERYQAEIDLLWPSGKVLSRRNAKRVEELTAARMALEWVTHQLDGDELPGLDL